MGTWTSDVVSSMSHIRPRATSTRAETYFKNFIRRRWQYWLPEATLHAKRENIALETLELVHRDRVRNLRELGILRKVVCRNDLDNPLSPLPEWSIRASRHKGLRQLAQMKPGNRFRKGHQYHPKKEQQ